MYGEERQDLEKERSRRFEGNERFTHRQGDRIGEDLGRRRYRPRVDEVAGSEFM